MSKYRIYELAKDFNTTSKVIIDILARNNITAKNHMSCVEEDARSLIEHTFARKADAPAIAKPTIANGGGNAGQNSDRQKPSPKPAPRYQQPGQSAAQHRAPAPTSAQPQGQTAQGARQQQNNRPFNPHQPNQQQRRPQNQQQGQQRPIRTPGQYQNNSPQGQRPQASGNQQPPRRPQTGQQQHQQAGQRPQGGQPRQHTSSPAGQQNRSNFSGGNNRPQPNNNNNNNNNNRFRNNNSSKNQQRPNNRKPGHRPPAQTPVHKPEPPKPKTIKLGGPVTVKELAGKLSREVSEVIKKLMMLGVMATINQEVDLDTATLIAGEFGTTVEELPPEEDPTEIAEIEDDPKTLVLRPPVVTVMGHVDHGKTSLLDAIRQTHVTSSEAGGITQHIGAYQVVYQGRKIVFLDTPGHEAFTAMRARGAQVTDIAILVVAADDGVMPQTIEAINHAKSANVPIVVAINKIDRPGANPDRVKQQLSEHGVVAEDWGGDTIMVPVSAYKKTGIGDLLEMVLLVAEMQEIKANPNRPAQGTIIEAQLDKGRGPVATVLVQKGTLRIGDTIIAGTAYGKVRAMVNDRGDKIKKAEPSTPVEVLGLSDVPQAGDVLVVVDEKTARSVAEKRIAKKRSEDLQQNQKVSLDDIFKQIKEGTLKDLNIVIKADVQGSIEALRQALLKLSNDEVRVSVVHAGVGAINESDVMLASASNALIIGFNVRPDGNARKAAEAEKIDIRTYRVIYDAINDVQAAITGMLAPQFKENILGRLEIRQVISFSKALVAGCYVLEGKATNNSQVRIIRDGIVIHEDKIESLRRFKDDVKEVATGFECGVTFEKFRDFREGDIVETFIMEEVKQG